jgi:hypothetical protein
VARRARKSIDSRDLVSSFRSLIVVRRECEGMPPLHYAMCGCKDLPGYPQRWGGKP